MTAPHATLAKFGYPAGTVAEYAQWAVLLRPKQATLGALVLACKNEATAFADIGGEAFAELPRAVGDLEAALREAFAYERLNYLMLMMVDPHVHFHILPRYSAPRLFEGQSFADPGWPGPPDIAYATDLREGQTEALRETLQRHWPRR